MLLVNLITRYNIMIAISQHMAIAITMLLMVYFAWLDHFANTLIEWENMGGTCVATGCYSSLHTYIHRKMPCKYGPIFAPYLHDWTLYDINTVQKRVRIYMVFFLWSTHMYCQLVSIIAIMNKNVCTCIAHLLSDIRSYTSHMYNPCDDKCLYKHINIFMMSS